MERVAIINSVYDKSTGKIASGLHKYLKKNGYISLFCYGYGKKLYLKDTYRIDTKLEHYAHALMCRLTGIQGAYSSFATKRLIYFLRKQHVDTVYGIGLHGYYINEKMLFNYIIKENIKFIYIMTEEYAFLGKCGYSNGCLNYLTGCGHCPQLKEYPKSFLFDQTAKMFRIKKNAYSCLKKTVFVGPEYTIQAAKKSPLMDGIKTQVIDEAIDLSLYYPRNPTKLRESLGILSEKIILLCVAPLIYERKGCRYFIDLARCFEKNGRYVFVHIGFSGNQKNLPSNYIAISYEADQEKLAQYYSLADLFVFPSLLDTMPNACLEALACGTPLLCFNISGMPYLADDETATFVEPKNIDQMAKVVIKTNKKDQETIEKCRKYAERRYDNQMYYQKLLDASHNLK